MDQPTQEQTTSESAEPKETLIDYTNNAFLIGLIDETIDAEKLKAPLAKHVRALAKKHSVNDYAVLLLIDESDNISEWHSNRIYQAASSVSANKDILLLIQSRGGKIEPAYLISKTCKRLSKNKFVVAIPRKAKSAATLISLGADEIHMGLMSELGPIDPQIGGLPALGMKNALALLADLSCKYPGAASMLSEYLTQKLDLNLLGYFDRISESAIQYAERLLPRESLPKETTANKLAEHFVNYYKDHGFVIDVDEATTLLGKKIIKSNSKEYAFANELYESLDFLRWCMGRLSKKDFDYVGSIDNGLYIKALKQ